MVPFLLMACLLGMTFPQTVLAAKAKEALQETVGYVDRQQIFNNYPGIQQLLGQIQGMRTEAQKDYDARSKDLPPEERRQINDAIAREEAQKEDQLMKPVMEAIDVAIQAVAAAKGLSVILDASVIIRGGVDITADVITKVKQ